MTLSGGGEYAIHGTNDPGSVGAASSPTAAFATRRMV
jgi:hypothetical protein